MNGVAFISTAKQADLLADLTGSDTSLSLFQIISLADLKATIFNTALLLVDEASLPVGDISATTLLDFISSASFLPTILWLRASGGCPAICLLEAGIERYLGPDHAEAELRFTLQILLKGAGLIPSDGLLPPNSQQATAAFAAITDMLQLEEIFQITCRVAVELFQVDHSGLVVFEPGQEYGRVVAEYPSWGALNRPIPLSGSPLESELITSARPFYIPDVAQAAQLLGPVQNTLLSLDIDALLLVPVQVDGRVFGSFSLDVSGRTRPFTLREITLCQRFADQVGQAILRSGKSVPKTKETLPQAIDEQQIARTIVTQAVTLLGANGGGLYRYQPSHNMLSLIATYDQNDTQLNGVTLAIGEGAAGHLIASEKPYLIIPNYEQWGQRARVYEGKYFFGAVVEVPLRHADNIIGVLFVNDMVGRQFTTEDAHLLQLFADQAATAWYHAQLSTLDAARLHRLEILTQASATIMRMLGRVSVPDLLQQIAHHGADILQAEACSVLLVKQPGFLTFVAGHGYDADKLPLGREFAIRSGPGTGLTGHIADKGLLFNEHGATLLQHPAVSGKETPLVASGHCYAMLGLPLQHEGKLVGLLRVENKKNERGEVDPLLPFDQQDEWILRLLADAILVAIDNATLMDEMDIEKEHLTRLLQNVPSAVVANDLNGRIFFVNAQAEEILGYTAAELNGQSVVHIFAQAQDAHDIRRRLQEGQVSLRGHEVVLRHRHGGLRPVRLTVNQLYDAQKNTIGAVGYFEDMRVIQETRQRLAWMLQITNEVSQADSLPAGIQPLSERIANLKLVRFCAIWTLTPDEDLLTLQGFATQGDNSLTPIERQMLLKEWPDLDELLKRGGSQIVALREPLSAHLLGGLLPLLPIDGQIESINILPLRTNARPVGVLYVGLGQTGSDIAYADELMELVSAVAEQMALLIERLINHEDMRRRKRLLTALHEASRFIRAELLPSQLWREMVRLALDLTGCTAGGLLLHTTLLGELRLTAVYNLPDELLNAQVSVGQGLIGQAAQGTLQYTNDYPGWSEPDELLAPYHFETVVAVPLQEKTDSAVSAVLFIADNEPWRRVTQTELDVLERFAAQAAVTLHTASLMTSEQRAYAHLDMLQKISNYVQMTDDMDKVLHIFLTGITAGYGLGFNRAVFLLVDDTGMQLVGQAGIGHVHESDARDDWGADKTDRVDEFDGYLHQLEIGGLPPTPIAQQIGAVLVPLAGIAPNALIQVVNSGQYVLLEPWQMDQMPLALREVLQPETAVILMPLLVRDRVIGIIAADNRYTRVPISSELIELLATFAGAAAIAIDKTRLLLETRLAQKRLHAFYEGSQSLVSTTEPEIVLQQIADKAREVALAEWVALILIDANGYMQRAVHSYEPGLITPTGTIRPTGLSQTIMATGQDIIIHNLSETHLSVSPSTLERGIQAAAGFPISVRGRRIGVMWIHYRIPHHFTNAEQEALKLFVNQAALAYENTIRFRDLDNLRQAAQRLAAATSRQHVLAEIVDTACTVLEADSAAIWLFDASRDQFLLQDWRAASDDDRLIWEQLQENVPSPGGMAYQIMEMDWIGIDAVADHTRYEFLSPSTSEFLQRLDVNSFQGVALAVGNEKLGVLYINYHQRRSFSTEDRNMTRNFAVQASLALKKAILLDGFRSARDAAQVVARMTTLESLDKTLESVLTGTKEALNCDAITLHIYDSQHEVMESQPYMMGVQDAAAATRLPKIPPHSITYQILERESYYIADNTAQDPLFRNRPFVLREKIATCVALPLRVGAEKVGVLFINYRTHHLLTGDDLGNINLFGNQAAIAIYNAQLFQREQNRTRALEAMYNAGRTVAVSLNLDQILTQIVQQAWYLVRYQQKQASYASIWRVIDDTHAELVATYPTEAKTSTVNRVGNVINWRTGKNGRIGIIGRVIHTGVTVLAADVLQDRDYLETQPSTRSEVAVPILINGQVMGVINLEHESVDAFQKENVAALESLATQAAIAIRNSTLFDITVKHARLLGAAAKVASQAITILDEDELLREAVALITDQLDFYHAAVFLLDDEEETAWLRAAASPAADVMLAELYHLPVGVGVVGTVAQTGRPYLVSDIRQDTHHLFNPHLPHTQSEMAFPLVARGKVIGVLDVQSQQRIPISPEEEAALQTMANQLANAVQNARYYAQVLRRADNLQAVQVAGQAISGSLEQETVLNNIVEQAWRLTGTHGPEAQLSCLALINEDRQSLEFVAAYPGNVLPQLKKIVGHIHLTDLQRFGIMGRAYKQKEPQLVADVRNDPNYISYDSATLSELAVPILLNGEVIGVINVEHPQAKTFDTDDQRTLMTLAAHAAVVIEKARRYQELRDTYQALQQTHRMMEARTAVACLGMASSIYGHDIVNRAIVIREQLHLLQKDLQAAAVSTAAFQHRLDMIARSADRIRNKPLTLPLGAEESMEAVLINDLVGERARQLWQNDPYRQAELALTLDLRPQDSVWASAEWLRRVLDILLENAVKAVRDQSTRRVVVETHTVENQIEIAIIDSGSGLPPDVQAKIGIDYIERTEDAEGLGMGLLMAHIIVQAYHGQLSVGYTGATGTCMRIRLPLFESRT